MTTDNRQAISNANLPIACAFMILLAACEPNEKKMSKGERGRTSLGAEVWKSSQKVSLRLSAVRSIAWLGTAMQ